MLGPQPLDRKRLPGLPAQDRARKRGPEPVRRPGKIMAALDGEDRGIDADENHIEPVSEEIGQGPDPISFHGLRPFLSIVIPAKAGIQSLRPKSKPVALDPRLRVSASFHAPAD